MNTINGIVTRLIIFGVSFGWGAFSVSKSYDDLRLKMLITLILITLAVVVHIAYMVITAYKDMDRMD